MIGQDQKRVIFHIDANSAYLSWEAIHRLQHDSGALDLRTVPSAVGGDSTTRHGIILAKSIPAKKLGVQTGNTLWEARIKCPGLIIAPVNYALYMKCSNAMVNLLHQYSPVLERYSIDECFLDLTGSNYSKNPVAAALEIKKRIKDELGFTVNIGISCNKLLAKMGSELKKPDRIHTLFPEEIPDKYWPLPVREMFMVGSRTAPKLQKLNINTIGDLAGAAPELLKAHLKSQGILIWKYANGLDNSEVHTGSRIIKGLGNSTTTAFNVENKQDAGLFLLSLVETAAMRLRDAGLMAQVISVGVRNTDFVYYSHQSKLPAPTDATNAIYTAAQSLLNEMWRGESIRHFGMHLTEIISNEFYQSTFFDALHYAKKSALDQSIDRIRLNFGSRAVFRAGFLYSGIAPLNGGVYEDYPMMSSLL